jgi:predicted membrane-bound mannosyltransferase
MWIDILIILGAGIFLSFIEDFCYLAYRLPTGFGFLFFTFYWGSLLVLAYWLGVT